MGSYITIGRIAPLPVLLARQPDIRTDSFVRCNDAPKPFVETEPDWSSSAGSRWLSWPGSDTADASDCPCINGGAGACVRDPACEAAGTRSADASDVRAWGAATCRGCPALDAAGPASAMDYRPLAFALKSRTQRHRPAGRRGRRPLPRPGRNSGERPKQRPFRRRSRSAAGRESSRAGYDVLSELGKRGQRLRLVFLRHPAFRHAAIGDHSSPSCSRKSPRSVKPPRRDRN